MNDKFKAIVLNQSGEKFSREIEECNDIETLQEMCKFLLKLEMKTRSNYSVMIQDLLPDLSTPTQ